MEKEKEEVQQAVQEKEEVSSQEIRASAVEELKEYRESELSTLLRDAEKGAEKEIQSVQSAYDSKKKNVSKKLVATLVGSDSPLLQH